MLMLLVLHQQYQLQLTLNHPIAVHLPLEKHIKDLVYLVFLRPKRKLRLVEKHFGIFSVKKRQNKDEEQQWLIVAAKHVKICFYLSS